MISQVVHVLRVLFTMVSAKLCVSRRLSYVPVPKRPSRFNAPGLVLAALLGVYTVQAIAVYRWHDPAIALQR